MTISYDYDSENNIIWVKSKGILSAKEIVNYVTTIIENKDIKKGFVEIADLESVEDFIMRYSDMSPFPSIWIKYLEKGCMGTIVYAPTDMSFGSMRMFQTAIQSTDEAERIPFIVVRTRDEIDEYLKRIRT